MTGRTEARTEARTRIKVPRPGARPASALAVVLLAFLLSGCGGGLSYTLVDDFDPSGAALVVVVPLETDGKTIDTLTKAPGRTDAAAVLSRLSAEGLREKNYIVISFDEAEVEYQRLVKRRIRGLGPGSVAELFGADSVLVGAITDWDEKLVTGYGSLTVGVSLSLYSRSGELLWEASMETSESELRLDREAIEFSVIKAFEPRLERLVDSLLLSLPDASGAVAEARHTEGDKAPGEPGDPGDPEGEGALEKKKFFDWLP